MNKLNVDTNYIYFFAALKYVADHRWYRQNQVLAEEAGISRSFLSNILAGKEKKDRPSLENQMALAQVNGCTYEEFIEEGRAIIKTGAPKGKLTTENREAAKAVLLPERLKDSEYVAVPLMDMSAAAGHGYEISTFAEVIKPLIFEVMYLNKLGDYNSTFGMFVYGDSMEPVLPNGALILVDKSQTQLWQGKMYLVRLGSMLYIKYVEADDKSIILKSENKARYNDRVIDLTADQPEDYEILGRVIWYSCEG